MNAHDTLFDVIRDINRLFLLLDGHIIKEVKTSEQRKQAGDLLEHIESEIAKLKKICQKD